MSADLQARRESLAKQLAELQWDLGGLAYEMAIFANRAGPILTPQLIEELRLTVRT